MKGKNKLLCFCLPTINIADMNRYLVPSLKNIGKLKDYASFSITFQPPYTDEEIKKCLKVFDELAIDYKYQYKEYCFEYGSTPLTQMRQDCALRYPEALFYALLDDDMSFEEGIDIQYLNLLELMLKDKNIGIACIRRDPYYTNILGSPIKYGDFERFDYSTNSGIIYRGGSYYGFTGLIPEELVKLVGGKQDFATAYWRVLQGQSTIYCTDGKCGHYENRYMPGYREYDWASSNEKGTVLGWLEEHGFIRWYNLAKLYKPKFYINLDKIRCKELYKKGCKSSQTYFFPYIKKIEALTDSFLSSLDRLIAEA